MGPLILLAFMAVFGYFMLIRPMRVQKRMREEMMARLGIGASVLTVGGIYGRVAALRDDDLDLEVADGVVLRVNRRGIASVEEEAEPEDFEPELEPELESGDGTVGDRADGDAD